MFAVAALMLCFVFAFAQTNQNFAALVGAIRSKDTAQVKRLIDGDANLANMSGEDGRTPLLVAATDGNSEIVSLLARSGASLEATDEQGRTALLLAATKADVSIARALLKAGADPNAKDNEGKDAIALARASGAAGANEFALLIEKTRRANNALVDAVKNSDSSRIASLIADGASPNATLKEIDEDGSGDSRSVLTIAVQNGDIKTIDALLAAGADVNFVQPGDTESTALDAAAQSDSPAVLQRLLQANPSRTTLGNALSSAVFAGKNDYVSALIKAGADVNAHLESQPGALANAAGRGDASLVQTLIAAGANRASVNDALINAISGAKPQEIAQVLIKAGADVNYKNEDGDTVLTLAATAGDANLTQFFLRNGANADNVSLAAIAVARENKPEILQILLNSPVKPNLNAATEDEEKTALMVAAEKGFADIAQTLIKAGAKVNQVSGDSNALLAAIDNNQTAMVKLLISAGADVNAAPGDTTPLELAQEKKSAEIVALLKQAGAKE